MCVLPSKPAPISEPCQADRNVTNADCMILISLSYGKQSQVSLSRTASPKAAAEGVVGFAYYSDEVMLQDVEQVKYLQNIDLGLKDSDQAAHSPLIAIAKLFCQRNLRVRTEQSENRRRGRRNQRQPRYEQPQDEEEEEIEVEETEEENEPVGRLRSTTPSSGVAHGDMDLRFVWQGDTFGTGLGLVTRLGPLGGCRTSWWQERQGRQGRQSRRGPSAEPAHLAATESLSEVIGDQLAQKCQVIGDQLAQKCQVGDLVSIQGATVTNQPAQYSTSRLHYHLRLKGPLGIQVIVHKLEQDPWYSRVR
eukprot:s26_g79.t1